MSDEEFTDAFEMFIMETFFASEPMNEHLQTKIPDEIDRLWLKQVLEKAKKDRVSLALYDTASSSTLPIAYAINHHDRKNHSSDILYSFSTESNGRSLEKYEHINHIMTKLHQGIDLFAMYQYEEVFHIYLLGVDPKYRQKGLAGQLIDHSIRLAKEKNVPLIYADVTSRYSLNAFVKRDFHVIRTIDYHSYENVFGEKVFQGLSIHPGCSIVVKDLQKQWK